MKEYCLNCPDRGREEVCPLTRKSSFFRKAAQAAGSLVFDAFYCSGMVIVGGAHSGVKIDFMPFSRGNWQYIREQHYWVGDCIIVHELDKQLADEPPAAP